MEEEKGADSIADLIKKVSPYYKKEDPVTHTLTYESYAETLEPIYYFVLDLMEDFGTKPEKLIDNFSPSPGSVEFGELGTRASVMQQQASGMLEKINAVLKSVLNILYDLKDFRTRLQVYDDLHSNEGGIKTSARLSLKQIWMDKVDIMKGNSSIKAMAIQGVMPLLINAFLASNTVHDVETIDLNEVTKRVLLPRVQEFNNWIEQSERELRNRYAIEKNYLRGQVDSLKLYSRWARPYLLSAQKLEQTESKSAALVTAFNRTVLQLTLLGKSELKIKDLAIEGELPSEFASDRFIKRLKKKYYNCVLVDFLFRAVPQKTQSGSTYIGRVDIKFAGYSLTNQELDKLKQELEQSDIGDALKLIKGITEDSLNQIQEEINFFLEEKENKEKQEEEKSSDESNPFLALIGHYNKPKEKPKEEKKEEKKIIVEPDNWVEKNHLRKLSEQKAKEQAFNFFDIYKKAHRMPSYT